MKRLVMLISLLALGLGLTGTALGASGTLPHTGRVLIVASGDVEVATHESADAVIVLGGHAIVSGTVETLVVVEGTASVTGATLETIAIVNGTARLDGGTTVLGDVHELNATVDVAPGTEIGGRFRDLTGDVAGFGLFMGAAMLLLWIGFALATLLFALLLVGLAARQVRCATTLISREPGKTALVGLVSLIVPPLLAALAIVTIVGIPTGIAVLLFAWPAIAFIGYIVAAIWLGEWLLGRREGATPPVRPYGAAVVGLIVASVIGLVPLVTAILSIFGLGAVVLAAWRTLRGGGSPQPVMWAQPAPAA